MANELTPIELFGANNAGQPRTYTIASSATVTKGTLMTLADPRTVNTTPTKGALCAGVAAMDKTADWSTQITVLTNGVFDAVASGSITVGNNVMMSNSLNKVEVATEPSASGAAIVGISEDSVTDGQHLNLRINK